MQPTEPTASESLTLTEEEMALLRQAVVAYDVALREKIGRLQAIRNGQPIAYGQAWIAPSGQKDRGIDIGEDDLLAVIHLNQAQARVLLPLLERLGLST